MLWNKLSKKLMQKAFLVKMPAEVAMNLMFTYIEVLELIFVGKKEV